MLTLAPMTEYAHCCIDWLHSRRASMAALAVMMNACRRVRALQCVYPLARRHAKLTTLLQRRQPRSVLDALLRHQAYRDCQVCSLAYRA
jgi:hypothetical protein